MNSQIRLFAFRCCAAVFAILLCTAALSPVLADGGKDCAPVGALPNFLPEGPPRQMVYDFEDFETTTPDGSHEQVTVAGHICKQNYDLKKGAEELSALEVLYNYRDQFATLGAEVTYKTDTDIQAKLVKNGQETWMEESFHTNLDEIDITVVEVHPMKQTLLPPSGKDYRLLGHMPNYSLTSVDKSRFDEHEFMVHSADGNNRGKVEGARYDVTYDLKKGALEASSLEVLTNYANALKQMGAVILYNDDGIVARYDDKGRAVWMEIDTGGDSIYIHTIEEKAFQATIKPPDASAMKTALDKDGHIALYIHFDFNKATLRPDAAPIIAQVGSLLKNNPDLKLSVEGNTDNVGGHDYNVKLSKDRAAAVVAELVKAGIAAVRLKSSGNGPDKPVSDNDDSMGRAKNRRVELVKM